MNRNRQEKGITLIALVITIIVLLILAGVTLTMVLGENGLINKAQSSVDKYKESATNEQKLLNSIEEYIMLKGSDGLSLSATRGTYTYPTAGSFEVTSDISGGEVTATSSDEEIVTVSVSGSTITVTPQIKGGTATITVSYKGKTATHEATVDFVLPLVTVQGNEFFVLEDNGSSLKLLSKKSIGNYSRSDSPAAAQNFASGLGGSGRLMTKSEAETYGKDICACGDVYWLHDYKERYTETAPTGITLVFDFYYVILNDRDCRREEHHERRWNLYLQTRCPSYCGYLQVFTLIL